MNLITLHRKYTSVAYQSNLCSFAAFITLLFKIFSLVLPLTWIFIVNKFFAKNDLIGFEQPMVKFKFKYILIAENSINTETKPILCSTFDYIGQIDHGICDKIKIIEKDENFDGIPDWIEFSASFATNFNYGIKSLSLVLFLDVRLKQHQCYFDVPSAVIIKKTFVNNINNRRFVIKGSLQPNQKQALVCPSFLHNTRSHFFSENLNRSQTDFDELKIEKVQENLERNPTYFHFQEAATDLQEIDSYKTIVKIKLLIKESSTRYKKSFWQIANDFWINYIATFIVTYGICNILLNHLFLNRWLMARKLISTNCKINSE